MGKKTRPARHHTLDEPGFMMRCGVYTRHFIAPDKESKGSPYANVSDWSTHA